MLITRVEVENFRSIVKGRAIITEGINFVHGPNGSGKTSLLEAIAMGLYGTEWIRGRYKLGDLVRRGASSALIRLEVVGNDGKKYLIQRVFTADKTIESQTYILDENGRRVAVRDRETTQFITSITGISMETFSELLYIRQGEIREILRSGRKGEFRFDTLLKLDSIERARQDVVREGIKNAEIILEGLRGKLSVLNNELKVRMDEEGKLKEELSRLKNELNKAEDELNKVNDEIEKLKIRENELDSAEQEYITISQRIESINKQLTELTNNLETTRKEYDELTKLSFKIEDENKLIGHENELRRRLKELEVRRDEVKGRIALIQERKAEINQLNEELREINERITNLNNELEQIDKMKDREKELRDRVSRKSVIEANIDRLKEELTRIGAEIEHLNLELKLLNESGDKCPVCGRPLSKDMAEELRRQRMTQLNLLIKRGDELRRQLSSLSSLLEDIKNAEEELREIENELGKENIMRQTLAELISRRNSLMTTLNELTTLNDDELKAELYSIEDEMNKINDDIKEIENKRIKLAEIRGKLERINELKKTIENLENKVKELDRERDQLIITLKELEVKINELRPIRDRLNELNNRREELMGKANEIRGRIQALSGRLEELKREIENKNKEITHTKDEIGKYSKALEVLNRVHDTLDSIKPMVRRLFLDSVNEELTEMVRDIVHKGSYTSIEVNEDYEITIKRNDGISLPVEALSIGERNLVALFLRYAMARVIMGFIPILILDEPTEHLDEEHRRRIAAWIRSLSNGVRSIIITSHVDILETIADNIIRMSFINNKGESVFANA